VRAASERRGTGGALPLLATVPAAALLLRRLRNERGMTALLFVVIAATCFLFAAAPRMFNQAADDGFTAVVRAATPVQRNVTLAEVASSATRIGPTLADVRAEGDRLAAQLPPALTALVSHRSVRITSVLLSVTHPPSYETSIALRYQDGLAGATRLVAGRWPVTTGAVLPTPHWYLGASSDTAASQPPVRFEVAVSADAAAATGLKVGDKLAVTLDTSDPMLPSAYLRIVPTELDVVGLFEPLDPTSAYWAADGSLLDAKQVGTETRPSAQVTAAISADAYPGLAASHLPLHDEWQLGIDPQRLNAGQLDEVRNDLRRPPFGTGSELGVPDTPMMRTGLPTILDAYATQLNRAASLLALAAIGPLALAGAVLAMLAILAVTRRRAAEALARGRGASGAQVLAIEVFEGALVAGVPGAAGLLAAVLAVPARASALSPLLALAIGGGTVVLLAGTSWTLAWRPLGGAGGDAPRAGRSAPRRLVIELTVVVIAAAGALLIRERGLAVPGAGGTAGTAGNVAAVNPLLPAIPVLCGLAAGIVAVHLYPLPVRALGWMASRRRDLVPVLGLRSIGRHRAAASLALLVLMLTAASGAFASVVATSISRGQVVASYRDVGADYRIERTGAGALAASLAPSAIAGVEAVAPGIEEASAPFSSQVSQRASISIVAIDPQAYATVVAGTADDPGWPADFLAGAPAGGAATPAAAGPGSEGKPIPAILSWRLPGQTVPLGPGATFHMTVLGHDLVFRLVEQQSAFPGVGDGPFALVPLGWVRAAMDAPDLPPTVLWLRAGPAAEDPLAAAVGAAGSTRLVSRYDALASLRDAPLAAATATGFDLALIVAAAFMAIAIVGTVILSAARRNQDLAYLRTLGVTARQAVALTLIEQAPPVLIALAPGLALGVGVAALLEPGLGLAAFEGMEGLPLAVDPLSLVLLCAALLALATAAVLAGTWLSLSVRATDALRIGEH
jgi:putative ABC transport system permease protein